MLKQATDKSERQQWKIPTIPQDIVESVASDGLFKSHADRTREWFYSTQPHIARHARMTLGPLTVPFCVGAAFVLMCLERIEEAKEPN
jgi:hypothetical protein